jgi:UDP-N-acetylmuramate dehydrogenase
MALDRAARAWLTETFRGDVRFGEPMCRHTSFQVGGPAEALVRPREKGDLVRLVCWAAEQGIACMPLGAGSNILVRENGIQGIVIVLDNCLTAIVENDPTTAVAHVTAGAGAKLAALCAFALKNGLKGLNFALGIPGTVGGSIRVNAGARDGSMADVVASISVLLSQGTLHDLEKSVLDFYYRKLDWPTDLALEGDNDPIILEAVFCLERGDKRDLKTQAEQIMRQRKTQQPWTDASAGCIFKNPDAEQSAGKLIDMAGLKGKCIGDAQVSPHHANFIINKGQATADDVLALMDLVRSTVRRRFQIQLETEVKIVG